MSKSHRLVRLALVLFVCVVWCLGSSPVAGAAVPATAGQTVPVVTFLPLYRSLGAGADAAGYWIVEVAGTNTFSVTVDVPSGLPPLHFRGASTPRPHLSPVVLRKGHIVIAGAISSFDAREIAAPAIAVRLQTFVQLVEGPAPELGDPIRLTRRHEHPAVVVGVAGNGFFPSASWEVHFGFARFYLSAGSPPGSPAGLTPVCFERNGRALVGLVGRTPASHVTLVANHVVLASGRTLRDPRVPKKAIFATHLPLHAGTIRVFADGRFLEAFNLDACVND